MQSGDKNIQWYQTKFKAFEQSLNGEKAAAVHSLRRDAMRWFAELGFPTTRQEEWRFTNVLPISKLEFHPILRFESNGITRDRMRPYLIEGAIQLVFINGMYASELSDRGALQRDVIAGGLSDIMKKNPEKIKPYLANQVKGEENGFTALNTAFLRDGACILVPQGIVLERPIQMLFVASDSSFPYISQPRNLIIAGVHSQFKIAETFVGVAQNTYLTNSVTEIVLEDQAIVEHDKVQRESLNAYHIGTTHLRMNAGSSYTSNVFSLGGAIVRNNNSVELAAEGIECTLNGLSLAAGTQVIDNHTAIDHVMPHCNSHELYKAILDGASKGVFNGKIFVRKDAQKTDAKQTNKTLLLSDDTTINTKPQLEIFADDVKCTHGATIGQLDAEQVFYLRSRGIDLASARDILTFAFAADIVNRVTIEPLRAQLEEAIQRGLKQSHRV